MESKRIGKDLRLLWKDIKTNGDNFDYNGNNTFNEFSRHTSDRYIARTGSVYSPQTSRPSIPEKGMVIYDDSLNKLILYNGSAWVNMDGTSLSSTTA